MVSIEDLLKRVQQAETETEQQWILLELQMSQMPDDLVSMLWAVAIPHFFDANILAALLPELADRAERLYADLQRLTFIEEFPGHGYNIHDLTRKVLLNQFWQQNQEEFLRLSKRAADYFFDMGTSSVDDVEFCYHEILNEGKAQTGRLLERAIDWWTYYQIDRIQSTLQGFAEHEEAGRLDLFGRGFSLHLKGLIKSRSGNYSEAESFFSRAQAIYEDVEPKNPRYVTTLLRDIGNSKYEQGSYQSALYVYETALRICEKQLGKNHPDTATSLDNLGSLYQSLERYEEAELNYLQALEIRKEQLGENHPHTAFSLHNLALLYQFLERYKQAESLHLQALKICEEQLGENHPDTATNLDNLALLYQKQERYKEAISLLERWKNIMHKRQETKNSSFARRVRSLGKLYEKCQQFPQAIAAYEEALSIFNQLLGSKHPEILVLKGELGRLKRRNKSNKKKSKKRK